ncbi:MAG: hypothetical protein ABMA64_10385 [Myxococcota bacterium]
MNPLREWSFRLRGALPWSMPAFTRPVPLEALSFDPAARARLDSLAGRYDLQRWAGWCTEQDWRESLYVLDVLDRWLPADLPPGRALDVGSKNGGYLPGLATAAPRGWDLVELDAHRRYLWGSTRRVYGERMARGFDGCRYIAGDVRDLDGPWAVVTWFLPFLGPEPLRAWGLPDRFLAPAELLRHVVDHLVPSGALLVVNQGEGEHAVQLGLFDALGAARSLEVRTLGPIESPLSPFVRQRFGSIVRAGR